MEFIRLTLAILVLSLLPLRSVYADNNEATVNFGVGIFNSGQNSLAETKILSVGYNSLFYDRRLFTRYELGAFADTAGGGRKSSAFGGYSFGVNVENSSFYGQGSAGAIVLSTPDSYLGGMFQFTEELSFGLNGNKDTKIGVFYKHMSSAGLYDPNIGRDFLGIKVFIPF